MMATGLSRPGKSREGPGMGRDRTGPRDLEGPVVPWSRGPGTKDVHKSPGLFLKVPRLPGSFFCKNIGRSVLKALLALLILA